MADDQIPTNPTAAVAPSSVPGDHYHTLGKKTFWIFILERIQPAMLLLILSIVLFVLSQQGFLNAGSLASVGYYALLGAGICSALFVLVLCISIFIAWMIYQHYTFALGEDSLKVRRGVLDKEEVAIPYRQIQDVDIDRDLSFQMIGLSKIVILTAGHEDPTDKEDETEGILPAIDKDLATWLQSELLKRADIQKVSEEK